MESKFLKAGDVIENSVNELLKGKDLSNFWKVDEALKQFYQDLIN